MTRAEFDKHLQVFVNSVGQLVTAVQASLAAKPDDDFTAEDNQLKATADNIQNLLATMGNPPVTAGNTAANPTGETPGGVPVSVATPAGQALVRTPTSGVAVVPPPAEGLPTGVAHPEIPTQAPTARETVEPSEVAPGTPIVAPTGAPAATVPPITPTPTTPPNAAEGVAGAGVVETPTEQAPPLTGLQPAEAAPDAPQAEAAGDTPVATEPTPVTPAPESNPS